MIYLVKVLDSFRYNFKTFFIFLLLSEEAVFFPASFFFSNGNNMSYFCLVAISFLYDVFFFMLLSIMVTCVQCTDIHT